MTDKQLRVDHDIVQRWNDHRDELAEMALDLGLTVSELPIGYSVSANGRQVAVFDLDDAGEFRWGWVEHATGAGRTDYRDEEPWAQALANVHNQGKARTA